MNIKGIIFDLDGVIISTDEFHYLAWAVIADDEDIYFDKEINNRLRGVSRAESLEIILENSAKKYTAEEKLSIMEEKNKIYRKLLANLTPEDVSVEVLTTLNILKKSGIKLAIGSSSRNAVYILQRLGLDKFFYAISDGNNITASKPDPEVFLTASRLINLNPEQCLVVEDAKAGVDAAHAGGFKCAALGDAFSYEKTDFPLRSLKDLISLLKIIN